MQHSSSLCGARQVRLLAAYRHHRTLTINEFEAKLTERINEVETKLTERINQLEVKLRERLARVEGSLDVIRDSMFDRHNVA